MQACGLSLALLAASLPAASGLRLELARRVSEPDCTWGDADPATGRLAISAARLGSHCCCALTTTSRGMLAVRSATRFALSFALPPTLRSASTSDALPLISA